MRIQIEAKQTITRLLLNSKISLSLFFKSHLFADDIVSCWRSFAEEKKNQVAHPEDPSFRAPIVNDADPFLIRINKQPWNIYFLYLFIPKKKKAKNVLFWFSSNL